jgi:hypothetical protein
MGINTTPDPIKLAGQRGKINDIKRTAFLLAGDFGQSGHDFGHVRPGGASGVDLH